LLADGKGEEIPSALLARKPDGGASLLEISIPPFRTSKGGSSQGERIGIPQKREFLGKKGEAGISTSGAESRNRALRRRRKKRPARGMKAKMRRGKTSWERKRRNLRPSRKRHASEKNGKSWPLCGVA